jgi:hypothetical protein
MADYSVMNSFIFSPNSKKSIKAVIRHLPPDTPAEDLGFANNVTQLTTNRRAPHGQACAETLPQFLVTLTRNLKPQEIFKLSRVMQSSNWPYLAQLQTAPSCLWCGGECRDKTNTESRPSCSSCTLVRRETSSRAQRAPKGPSGRTCFSEFTSPEQSHAAALRQVKQHPFIKHWEASPLVIQALALLAAPALSRSPRRCCVL